MNNKDDELHILIIDDDEEICALVSEFLEKHQIKSSVAYSVKQAESILNITPIDLVILDLMMPGEDGLSYCRRLRAESKVPIIMLTAMGEETDRIIGLEMGADDYLPKPFNPRELLARIRAVMRRYENIVSLHRDMKNERITFDGWQFNPVRRELYNKQDILISLTSGELDLLQAFLENPQRVLNRDQLLDITRGRNAIPYDRSIDVQLSRLRHKIEQNPKQPVLIKTIRNSGYMFTAEVEREPCV